MTDDENDRHGYSQPTLAQYEDMRRERDAARAELAALRERIEALADEADEREGVYDYGFPSSDDLRGALAGAAPAEDVHRCAQCGQPMPEGETHMVNDTGRADGWRHVTPSSVRAAPAEDVRP